MSWSHFATTEVDMEKVALVIGVNKYKDCPLKYCVNDAKEISSILRDQNYNFEVYELIDEEVTRRRTKEMLDKIIIQKPTFLLIYFAGHGVNTPEGGYICTSDSEPYEEGVSFDYISKTINRLDDTTKVFIVLDCCHSGGASISLHQPGSSNIDLESIKQELGSLGRGKIVLAACESYDKAKELDKLQHGLFTYHLINGLFGYAANSQGEITVSKLFEYISSQMEGSGLQQPVLRGDQIGKYIIGDGFQPIRQDPLRQDDIDLLEQEAIQHLEFYDGLIKKEYLGRNWKTSGYNNACKNLEPVSKWFKKRLSDHPELKQSSSFSKSFENLNHRLSSLTKLDSGTVTDLGEVVNTIGFGTFGTVYKIKSNHDKFYAYKVLHGNDIVDAVKSKRFRTGYEAMKRMDHPHIVKVHTLSECPLGFYMDFIEGSNFRDFSDPSMTLENTLFLLLTIADTLKHAHNRKVVHRDVKPENIIITYNNEQWRPYLTDFDLAWHSTATKITNEALGTLFYAAPEQLAQPKSPVSTHKTVDVFSFGQICFYTLCHSDPSPVDQDMNFATLSKRLNDWPTVESAQTFLELYKKCVERNIKDRLSSFEHITATLHRLINMLKGFDRGEIISVEKFIQEVIFSIVGLSPELMTNESSFTSPSGNSTIELTGVAININDIKINITISCSDSIMREGLSWEKLRQKLNKKIDDIRRKHKITSRNQGRSITFSTEVSISVSSNLLGVESVRAFIVEVIEAIETD
jgi:serine/threonine protein kinase